MLINYSSFDPDFMAFAPAPSAFLPLTNTLIAYLTGLLEQWIEYDLAGSVNPYGLGFYLIIKKIFLSYQKDDANQILISD